MSNADLTLITRWAEAWAISRGVGPPVPREGAFYIHVGKADQVGRYIFAHRDRDAIRDLAAAIDQPQLFLKVCADADAVRPLLPPGWEIATPGYMMTAPVAAMLDRRPTVPADLRLDITVEGNVTLARIVDPLGEEAAWGRIVTLGDLVMFDRIGTADAYQRRGLASAVMRTLARHANDDGIRDAVLCATPSGRALYETLGWSLHSDYTTASLSAENCATLRP